VPSLEKTKLKVTLAFDKNLTKNGAVAAIEIDPQPGTTGP
jgi:hypothetical protein